MLKRYDKIIEFMCEYKGISKDELYKLLRDKNCKYIFFLLLKKYGDKVENINNIIPEVSKRSINYTCRKAQEKFLINREFREMYFEIEDELKKEKM